MTSIADVYPVDATRMPQPRVRDPPRHTKMPQVASKPPPPVTQKVVQPMSPAPYISRALNEYICMCLIVFIILKMHIDIVQQLII